MKSKYIAEVIIELEEMDADLIGQFAEYMHSRFDGTAYKIGAITIRRKT